MHERPGDTQHPHEALVSLLHSDFTSVKPAEASSDNALGQLMSNVVSTEDIDARLAEPESAALRGRVEALVRDASVTSSFKSYIANEVRQAWAWRRPVDEAVSPMSLGLTSGAGIFDPNQAQAIEGRVLRGSLFDLIRRHTMALKTESETGTPPLLLRPDIRPADFAEAVDRLLAWRLDFAASYHEDAFAGQSREDYQAAAPTVAVPPDPDLEVWVERLKHLRDGTSPN